MAHILPSGGGKALINVDDTALLLLDHDAEMDLARLLGELSGG
jgi:hypothetical protein